MYELGYYKAKKKFGQNFLKDRIYVEKIVQSIPPNVKSYNIVEIGVGLGDLTDELLKSYSLRAYEVDRDLCSFLRKKYKEVDANNKLEIIEADVLGLKNQDGWLCENPYFLVSNLPYYIATNIILRVLRDRKCKGLVVMTQKEVAQKFCASSGDSRFSPLSILAQSFGKVDFLFEVPPTAFNPAPKVTSAVFRIQKCDEIILDFKSLESVLRVAFSSPRRKLFKNLSNQFDKDALFEIFEELKIEQDARAHEVETLFYHHITKKLGNIDGRKKSE